MFAGCTIRSVPPEIVREILILLPIGSDLAFVGFASKRQLAPFLFGDIKFAFAHFRFQLNFGSRSANIADALYYSSKNGWAGVPFNYGAFLFGACLEDERRLCGSDTMRSLVWKESLQSVQSTVAFKLIQILCSDLKYWQTPIYGRDVAVVFAASRGFTKTVAFLLKDPSVDPSALSSQALCCACMEGHEDIVRLLLLDSRVNPAAMRNTPFKLASMRGNEKIMKLLLSTGKVAGFTGFVNVCKYGLIGILQHLLEELQACSPVDKRRHVKILWEGVTSAYMNGHPDVMFAVMGFLDLWGQCQDYQLHASVRGYHESDTYIILSADWKEDYKLFANRVFHVAVGVGDSTHIEKFLHHTEIDPSLGNHFAFRRAVERGHINAVRLLLDKWNADPTADDNFPIRVAAQNGHIEIVKILLATGKVDVLAESSYAIRMAKKMGHKGIVSLLEDWVKDI